MFLTKLTLDPTAHRPRKLLRNTHHLHAAIAASFPDGEVGRVLWRLEPPRADDIVILVASPNGPDHNELHERITTRDRAETRAYGQLLERIRNGDRYRFRATLNPVRTHRGHHTPIVDRRAQTNWVTNKLATNGATMLTHSADLDNDEPDVQITSTVHDTFTRHGSTGRVELLKVTFDGTLQIHDLDGLRHALANGIGRAKGYGCGLITLAPM
jgi:CRISPR system Cascade subunit CasE